MRLLTLCLVSLLFASQWQTAAADDLLSSAKEIIAWLDALGYPDFSKTPLVEVKTSALNWLQQGDDSEHQFFSVGFLVAENGANFTVVDLSGKQTTHTVKHEENAPVETEATIEKLEIKKFAKEVIEADKKKSSDDFFHRLGASTSRSFETVLLARACVAQGHTKEAHQLFELAGRQKANARDGKNLSLIEFLKKDQAHTRMWRAVVAFGNADVTRPELLMKFEDITEHFPKSEHFERAKATTDLLKKMIYEDEAHRARKVPPASELKGVALVAELIFQLRTQNGQQWSQPGACDIFLDSRGQESPAARLIAIGFDAVPQLIEAISDQRFTRSVGYHRNFYFSHHVLRVGDCAETILSRIAGRSFYQRTSTNGAMTKDQQAKTTKKQVEAWWKEVQTKGEEKVLIEAVMSGDQNSAYQASLLLRKYPDSAVDAIREGLAKSKNAWVSQRMIGLLADDGRNEAMEIVRQQLTEGKDLAVRVQAAEALAASGHTKLAVERMLHEWANISNLKIRDSFGEDTIERVPKFLVQSGSVNAVKAVAKYLPNLDSDAQYEIIDSLANVELQPDPAYEKAVEAFLVDCLQITEELSVNGSYGDQSFSNPRVCDFAGYVLTHHWPNSYACRLDGTERDRDADRFAAINHWRKANGMKPVVVPEPFVVVPTEAKITNPLVDKIVQNKSHDESKKALAQLRELGPGAIKAVEKLSQDIDDSHPLGKQVKQLLSDLPDIITVVKTGEKLVPVKQSWQIRIAELQGQTFSSELVANLLTDFAKERPCAGIRFKAVREGGGIGVELSVDWVEDPAQRNGTLQLWNSKTNVRLGNQSLLNSVSGTALKHATDLDRYQNLEKAVKKSLASPDQSMKVSVSLVIDE